MLVKNLAVEHPVAHREAPGWDLMVVTSKAQIYVIMCLI